MTAISALVATATELPAAQAPDPMIYLQRSANP